MTDKPSVFEITEKGRRYLDKQAEIRAAEKELELGVPTDRLHEYLARLSTLEQELQAILDEP